VLIAALIAAAHAGDGALVTPDLEPQVEFLDRNTFRVSAELVKGLDLDLGGFVIQTNSSEGVLLDWARVRPILEQDYETRVLIRDSRRDLVLGVPLAILGTPLLLGGFGAALSQRGSASAGCNFTDKTEADACYERRLNRELLRTNRRIGLAGLAIAGGGGFLIYRGSLPRQRAVESFNSAASGGEQ